MSPEDREEKRFVAAALAMQGWLAGRASAPLSMEAHARLATASVECADSLLAELEKLK